MDTVTELIATRRVSSTIGSSLLNDNAYARDICMNLVLAAQTLFGAREREQLSVTQTVSLDELERNAVNDADNADDGSRKNTDKSHSENHTGNPHSAGGST